MKAVSRWGAVQYQLSGGTKLKTGAAQEVASDPGGFPRASSVCVIPSELIITQVNCTLLTANKPPQGAVRNCRVGGHVVSLCVADEAQGWVIYFNSPDSLSEEHNYFASPSAPQRPLRGSEPSAAQPRIRGYKNTARHRSRGAAREFSPARTLTPEQTPPSDRHLLPRL